MRADGDREEDRRADQGADNHSQPPVFVYRVAIGLDIDGTGEHESKEDKDSNRSRVNQDLYDGDEFGISQKIDAGGHREDDDQGQRAVNDVIQSHHQQSGTDQYHSNDPK